MIITLEQRRLRHGPDPFGSFYPEWALHQSLEGRTAAVIDGREHEEANEGEPSRNRRP